MEICNCRLKLDKNSCVPVRVTPAEVLLLSHYEPSKPKDSIGHFANAGGFPLYGVEGKATEAKAWVFDDERAVWYEDTGKDAKPRTQEQERQRLNRKFGKDKVQMLWPGVTAKLPETFKEIAEQCPWAEEDGKKLGLDTVAKAKVSTAPAT